MHSSPRKTRRVSLLGRMAFIPADGMTARSWLLLIRIGACANDARHQSR